jgi:excisionase family DNA binding protein
MLSNEALVKEGLLKVHPDATSFCGLSRSTLYELMDDGRLAYVKIGKARRIPKSALLALLAAHVVGGVMPDP